MGTDDLAPAVAPMGDAELAELVAAARAAMIGGDGDTVMYVRAGHILALAARCEVVEDEMVQMGGEIPRACEEIASVYREAMDKQAEHALTAVALVEARLARLAGAAAVVVGTARLLTVRHQGRGLVDCYEDAWRTLMGAVADLDAALAPEIAPEHEP